MNRYVDITVHPLSSSVQEERYLLSCRGHYYEASAPVAELVEELRKHPDEEEAIAAYVGRTAGKYTAAQIRQVIDTYLAPLFEAQEKKRVFLYEKELFGAATIDKFSDRFRFLFHRACMTVVALTAVVLNVYFFLTTEDVLLFNNKVDVYTVVGLFVFMLASSFFHELGHASACKYFGVRHGGVGFGLYLNFPVLYTDVTEVWRLKRSQRCIVNLAGVYFQSYGLIAMIVLFLLTGNDILRYLILMMNFGFVMTLNPFFKFDGYWIASDLLGVPNLRTRSMELLGYGYKRLRRRPVTKTPYLLQIRPLERYGLLLYAIVVNLFMASYFFYIIPRFLYRFVQTFPDQIHELILYLSNNITPPFTLLRNIGAQLLFVGLLGYLCWKAIRPLIKKYVGK